MHQKLEQCLYKYLLLLIFYYEYKLHLQKTVLNIREKQQKNYFNLQNPTFVPIPYENAHSPLYFIAVCRKK